MLTTYWYCWSGVDVVPTVVTQPYAPGETSGDGSEDDVDDEVEQFGSKRSEKAGLSGSMVWLHVQL